VKKHRHCEVSKAKRGNLLEKILFWRLLRCTRNDEFVL